MTDDPHRFTRTEMTIAGEEFEGDITDVRIGHRSDLSIAPDRSNPSVKEEIERQVRGNYPDPEEQRRRQQVQEVILELSEHLNMSSNQRNTLNEFLLDDMELTETPGYLLLAINVAMVDVRQLQDNGIRAYETGSDVVIETDGDDGWEHERTIDAEFCRYMASARAKEREREMKSKSFGRYGSPEEDNPFRASPYTSSTDPRTENRKKMERMRRAKRRQQRQKAALPSLTDHSSYSTSEKTRRSTSRKDSEPKSKIRDIDGDGETTDRDSILRSILNYVLRRNND